MRELERFRSQPGEGFDSENRSSESDPADLRQARHVNGQVPCVTSGIVSCIADDGSASPTLSLPSWPDSRLIFRIQAQTLPESGSVRGPNPASGWAALMGSGGGRL